MGVPRLRRPLVRAAAREPDAYMDSVNEQVTGEITLRLYKGRAQVGRAQLAERALRRGAGRLRRVRRPVLAAVEPRLHRALDASVADGLRDPEPGQGRVTGP